MNYEEFIPYINYLLTLIIIKSIINFNSQNESHFYQTNSDSTQKNRTRKLLYIRGENNLLTTTTGYLCINP